MKSIEIDGIKYVPQEPSGNRAVVVVDRGWIYAGDIERKDGRIRLTRAVWVFRWASVGFDGVLKDPKSDDVSIRPIDFVVDIPEASEVFCIPVCENWGL